METHVKLSLQQAELMRKAIKEIRWAAKNLEDLYNISKPAEAPVIEKIANQLELFNGEESKD